MIQGMGGMMSVTGEPDDAPGGGPQRAGVPVADIITACTPRSRSAPRSRTARRAEPGSISISRSSTRRLRFSPTRTRTIFPPARRPSDRQPAPEHRAVSAVPHQDGSVILACGNDNLYRKFCEVAGRPSLAADERFASNGKRVENRAELTRLLQAIFLKKDHARMGRAAGCGGRRERPINDVAQVFESRR